MVGLRSLAHAFAGAMVSIILSVLGPIGPFTGGAVAGYLEGGQPWDGIIVGVLATGLNVALLVTVWGIVLWALTIEYGVVSLRFGVTAFFVLFLLYLAVGSGGLGGLTGNYVRTETDWGRR